jgi:phosphoglycerol transferase MdoB-like AlkP superfamily enzyme
MNALFRFYLSLFLFWILFFCCQQTIFLLLNINGITAHFSEIAFSFYKGLRINLATTFYLLSLPILLSVLNLFIDKTVLWNKIIKIQNYLFIVICSFFGLLDAGIFKVWGTKVNAKAISYLAYPEEVVPAMFAMENVGLLVVLAIVIVLSIWLFNKIYFSLQPVQANWKIKILLPIVLTFVTIVSARGGLQKVPLNRNQVFFSEHSILNYASLNSFWNIADLLFNPIPPQQNPYKFFELERANELLSEMHHSTSDSSERILNVVKPNIVIIMLESWGADVISCLGGEKDVTPKFCELAKEGILFNNFFATGDRTEQGMLAILSGYPAQPISSIIKEFGKFDKLPNLYKVMKNNSYYTSYYCGGRLQFDNLEAYLRAAGVDKMVGEDDFKINKRTIWGAYDEETFTLHIDELQKTPQPFFSVLSTMTTHEWFEADIPQLFKSDAEKVNDGYRNTMHYADSCLFDYINKLKKTELYNNTLFVIVADHGCKFPKLRNIYEVERHRIPMLLIGGAIKNEWRGSVLNTIGSQTDIAETILSQVNISNDYFGRSKNLFAAQKPHFAYYAFDNGFGIINPKSEIVYDHNQQKIIYANSTDSLQNNKWLNYGKAYLQTNFQDNIDYATKK